MCVSGMPGAQSCECSCEVTFSQPKHSFVIMVATFLEQRRGSRGLRVMAPRIRSSGTPHCSAIEGNTAHHRAGRHVIRKSPTRLGLGFFAPKGSRARRRRRASTYWAAPQHRARRTQCPTRLAGKSGERGDMPTTLYRQAQIYARQGITLDRSLGCVCPRPVSVLSEQFYTDAAERSAQPYKYRAPPGPSARGVKWPRLSEQNFRLDKWSVCRS